MDKYTPQKVWDIHFMKEAKLWMQRSKCRSRKIGSVLVKDKYVIATGCNGPPSGVPHCDYRDDCGNYTDHFVSDKCPRKRMGFESGCGMEYCVSIHAEINPIMQAAKMGIPTDGAILYCYCGTPCINCAKEIIQAGIKRVVCLGKSGSREYIRTVDKIKDGDNPDKRGYNFPLSEKLFELAGVQLDVITEEEVNNG